MGFFSRILGIDEGERLTAVEMIKTLKLAGEHSASEDALLNYLSSNGVMYYACEVGWNWDMPSRTLRNKYSLEYDIKSKSITLYSISELAGTSRVHIIKLNDTDTILISNYENIDLLGYEEGIAKQLVANGARTLMNVLGTV